jgi:hypothetical protein
MTPAKKTPTLDRAAVVSRMNRPCTETRMVGQNPLQW